MITSRRKIARSMPRGSKATAGCHISSSDFWTAPQSGIQQNPFSEIWIILLTKTLDKSV